MSATVTTEDIMRELAELRRVRQEVTREVRELANRVGLTDTDDGGAR